MRMRPPQRPLGKGAVSVRREAVEIVLVAALEDTCTGKDSDSAIRLMPINVSKKTVGVIIFCRSLTRAMASTVDLDV